MTLSLELEIKTLLEKFGDPEVVGEKLVEFFESHSQEWSAESLQELARFLLSCGLYEPLIRFCLSHFNRKNFVLPWPYLIEALVRGLPSLSPEVLKFLRQGIEEEKAEDQVCLAEGAEKILDQVAQRKNNLRSRRHKMASHIKQQMLDELLTLRTQQLYEQEKITLDKMKRMFPGDLDILEEIRQHKERYAMDILSRRASRLLRTREALPEAAASPETLALIQGLKTSLIEAARTFPDLAYDFAVAAAMIEEPEASLAILESLDLSPQQRWFYLEVKIQSRHFLEVLNELNQLELILASDPETFYASAYLRAQAYWGLAQKHVAIEILESILNVRPNYRSGSALLDAWRSQ